MNNSKHWQKYILVAMSCLLMLLSAAQPIVKTVVDKKEILIGQQFKVKVAADFEAGSSLARWLILPDSIAHFEVVESTPIDSIYVNQRLSGLEQTFTLTSFDSGKWTFPSFPIALNASGAVALTDSFSVMVNYALADTSSVLKDIKAIREVNFSNDWKYWVAAAIAILVLGFLWWYLQRKNRATPSALPSNLSPYKEAQLALEQLKTVDLNDKVGVKQYHVQLMEIYRRYLSRIHQVDYLNKTTDEILLAINHRYADKELLSLSATAMRLGDAVKFAKYLPSVENSATNFQYIVSAIQLLEAAIHKNKPA